MLSISADSVRIGPTGGDRPSKFAAGSAQRPQRAASGHVMPRGRGKLRQWVGGGPQRPLAPSIAVTPRPMPPYSGFYDDASIDNRFVTLPVYTMSSTSHLYILNYFNTVSSVTYTALPSSKSLPRYELRLDWGKERHVITGVSRAVVEL